MRSLVSELRGMLSSRCLNIYELLEDPLNVLLRRFNRSLRITLVPFELAIHSVDIVRVDACSFLLIFLLFFLFDTLRGLFF